jgi:hypothetical protein
MSAVASGVNFIIGNGQMDLDIHLEKT